MKTPHILVVDDEKEIADLLEMCLQNENYQVYPNGTVGAGAYWRPGKDPWSIPAEGSVVRSFKAHGYSWGGDAWPTNKDYMHFSYMGV